MQELTAMGVHMRITEDNIDQIENMSYSKTIDRLLQEEGIDYTKLALQNKQLYDENDKQQLPVKDIEGDETEKVKKNFLLKKKQKCRKFQLIKLIMNCLTNQKNCLHHQQLQKSL